MIENFIKDNAIIHPRTMTQHYYLTNMANAIIDDDTGKELNYHQLSARIRRYVINPYSMNLGDYPGGEADEWR